MLSVKRVINDRNKFLPFSERSSKVSNLKDEKIEKVIEVLGVNRSNIHFWGRRSLFVLVYGLVICCFAAARDGLDKTIQYTIDGSCNPGIFSLVSIPNIIGCVGAVIIIVAAIATLIAKSQHMREIWFYVMSGGVMLKIVVMEISRIIQMF